VAPEGTPRAAIEWLQREIKQATSQSAGKTKLESLGFEPIAGTPDELQRHIKSEADRWSKVVRDANIQVQ
jgi:tripartite-type tricarboxylate transporter receptor subunit TctC